MVIDANYDAQCLAEALADAKNWDQVILEAKKVSDQRVEELSQKVRDLEDQIAEKRKVLYDLRDKKSALEIESKVNMIAANGVPVDDLLDYVKNT